MDSGNAKCHLRLRASFCLLKLANVKSFDKAITQPNQFELIAGTIQVRLDSSYTARVHTADPRVIGPMLHGQKLILEKVGRGLTYTETLAEVESDACAGCYGP